MFLPLRRLSFCFLTVCQSFTHFLCASLPPLTRSLRGQSAYSDRPLAPTCPWNTLVDGIGCNDSAVVGMGQWASVSPGPQTRPAGSCDILYWPKLQETWETGQDRKAARSIQGREWKCRGGEHLIKWTLVNINSEHSLLHCTKSLKCN